MALDLKSLFVGLSLSTPLVVAAWFSGHGSQDTNAISPLTCHCHDSIELLRTQILESVRDITSAPAGSIASTPVAVRQVASQTPSTGDVPVDSVSAIEIELRRLFGIAWRFSTDDPYGIRDRVIRSPRSPFEPSVGEAMTAALVEADALKTAKDELVTRTTQDAGLDIADTRSFSDAEREDRGRRRVELEKKLKELELKYVMDLKQLKKKMMAAMPAR